MPSLRCALGQSRGPTDAPVWTGAKEVRSKRAVGPRAKRESHLHAIDAYAVDATPSPRLVRETRHLHDTGREAKIEA